MTIAGRIVGKLFSRADIAVNGSRPWDIIVHDERAFGSILFGGSLGLGESYMNGWWDCRRPDVFFQRLLSCGLDRIGAFAPVSCRRYLRDRFGNEAALGRSFETGQVHYDLGNGFFSKMLDARMVYTCSYPARDMADTLDSAQERKLALVCAKLRLTPGMRVLDIGCGWGSFAKYAAENFGVHVTGITISAEQADFARNSCRSLPVSIELRDYRDFSAEPFDRIVSLGMFEHVEYKNHHDYFACVERNLASEGLFLLHTIVKDGSGTTSDPFIRKYVFPQGMIPGKHMLHATIAEESFTMLDWHLLGPWRYARTLRWWHEHFAEAWPSLEHEYGPKLDGRFRRMWEYYLLSCAGAFDAQRLDVLQTVIARAPFSGRYEPVRM